MAETILVFGDSNLWGGTWGAANIAPGPVPRLPYEARFSGLLQAAMGGEYRVVEDALPGRTAMLEDPLSPNRRGIRQLEVALEAHAPVDLLAMQLGTNELRQMFGMSEGMIACSVERLVALAKDPASGYPARRILLIAPHPTHPRAAEMTFGFLFGPDVHEKSRRLSGALREMAARQRVDFLDCAPLGFELNEVDGVHYSASDTRKLVAAVAARARAVLGRREGEDG